MIPPFFVLSSMPAGRTTNGVSLVSYTNSVSIQKMPFFLLFVYTYSNSGKNFVEQEAICIVL